MQGAECQGRRKPRAVVGGIFARVALVAFLSLTPAAAGADHLDPETGQLIIGIAPGWDSMHGRLWRLDRRGTNWEPAGPPVPVLFGKHGLAWGRGEIEGHDDGPVKVERDGRAPAGVFRLGTIYTYDESLPPGATYPYRTVGLADAWVDDVNDPNYNRHVVVVDPQRAPPWFAKNRMRQGDFAYRWLIEIRHNADPPTPGFGSAIFFHIRRGPDRPSAGCTTMAESDLVTLIRWLRADQYPRYVCLPRSEYLRYWKVWDLPAPSVLGVAGNG
ncbi:MAG: L,D-transpeptidase family protein [Verrucomicrobia bacterium]|nr:L,D-transpeptidase family protein [Verrucomicrobiota bacterium]